MSHLEHEIQTVKMFSLIFFRCIVRLIYTRREGALVQRWERLPIRFFLISCSTLPHRLVDFSCYVRGRITVLVCSVAKPDAAFRLLPLKSKRHQAWSQPSGAIAKRGTNQPERLCQSSRCNDKRNTRYGAISAPCIFGNKMLIFSEVSGQSTAARPSFRYYTYRFN